MDHLTRSSRLATTGPWRRFLRMLRYRLVIPILRSRHSAEYTARGIMIGLILAFTPTFGIQMILAFLLWVGARRVLRWDFSLVQAAAWTWVANYVTAIPIYYLLFVTGQLMLGRWSDISGYGSFLVLFNDTFGDGMSFWEQTRIAAGIVFLDWGLAMCVGALPWCALMGWLGYTLGLRFARHQRAMRAKRITGRAAG